MDQKTTDQTLTNPTTETRNQFWALWNKLRPTMPFKSANQLMAADHAAWIMFKELTKATAIRTAGKRDDSDGEG